MTTHRKPPDPRNSLPHDMAAEHIGVTPDELTELVKAKTLTPIMLNGRARFFIPELNQYRAESGRAVRWLMRGGK